ncbi:MAG: hypothetical protein FWE09_03855 [Treponema sp.]|nr:hypothetical protein [Treponema sp.]
MISTETSAPAEMRASTRPSLPVIFLAFAGPYLVLYLYILLQLAYNFTRAGYGDLADALSLFFYRTNGWLGLLPALALFLLGIALNAAARKVCAMKTRNAAITSAIFALALVAFDHIAQALVSARAEDLHASFLNGWLSIKPMMISQYPSFPRGPLPMQVRLLAGIVSIIVLPAFIRFGGKFSDAKPSVLGLAFFGAVSFLCSMPKTIILGNAAYDYIHMGRNFIIFMLADVYLFLAVSFLSQLLLCDRALRKVKDRDILKFYAENVRMILAKCAAFIQNRRSKP